MKEKLQGERKRERDRITKRKRKIKVARKWEGEKGSKDSAPREKKSGRVPCVLIRELNKRALLVGALKTYILKDRGE